MNILFDGLNNETVPDHAIDQMSELAKGECKARKAMLTFLSHREEGCKYRLGDACGPFDKLDREHGQLDGKLFQLE